MAESAFSIRSRVPWDEYVAIDALNISRLKELARSPLHYQHRLANPLVTPPLILGTAAHCATLEPERFPKQFAVWSRRTDTGRMAPRNGKHWDAFQAEHHEQTIITEDEADAALAIAHAVRSDPVAKRYLAAGDPEVTLQWQIEARACKGRVDWVTRDPDDDGRRVLVGLKTTRDCRAYQFGSQAAKLGYAMAWAWYFNGYVAIRDERPGLIEIVIESAPPYAVCVYRVPHDVLVAGEDEYLALLERLRECEDKDEWPGPYDAEQEITLPSWYYGQQAEDVSDLGLVGE